MIEFDEENSTYTCPFCNCVQCYNGMISIKDGNFGGVRIELIHLKCSNKACGETTVLAQMYDGSKQWDLLPEGA
ncbi:hypothetical protein SDC9_98252 [bioreactor metagenome]|uniref:Uncharacterized protein n=1 Tax=bioreactor metagenome TaxID=1076179 RepID=A0A645AKX3_9ZZZZ